jgi:hypothetical protein
MNTKFFFNRTPTQACLLSRWHMLRQAGIFSPLLYRPDYFRESYITLKNAPF